jgi:hypothetical protein
MPLDPAVIDDANPYVHFLGAMPPVYDPPPVVVEQQFDVGNWNFKGVPHFIEKAIRIPYTYVDANNVTIRDYLLIGYEGGGAY